MASNPGILFPGVNPRDTFSKLHERSLEDAHHRVLCRSGSVDNSSSLTHEENSQANIL